MGYEKQTRYYFEVWDTGLVITDIADDYMMIEETRKNGQEDTHMFGCVVPTEDGNWKWDEIEGETFSEYEDEEFASDILKYIQQHGRPE